LAGEDWLRPILPQPAHRIGEYGCCVPAIMRFFTPSVVDLVSSKLKGTLQCLIAHPPIAEFRTTHPFVIGTVDYENANWLGLSLTHQHGIAVTTAHTDKCSDRCEDTTESLWMFPGERDRSDSTSAQTPSSPVIRVL
jgi:hypothetical protein